MKRRYPFAADWVTEPGEHLRETLEVLRVSLSEFARRTGYSTWYIERLLTGQARIRPLTARRVALGTGVAASLWINLETNYQTRRQRLARR